MKAPTHNCTLKRSPEESNTGPLASVAEEALRGHGVETGRIRLADHVIEPGVVSEKVTDADERPAIRERILAAGILIVATPTWLGRPSSIAERALERMDAVLSETRGDGTRSPTTASPASSSRATRTAPTRDGGGRADIGYTLPAQGWTYRGSPPTGPGRRVLADHRRARAGPAPRCGALCWAHVNGGWVGR